jgi:hypothetical protein
LAKNKLQNVDGLGPSDIEKIRNAIRQVWHWSHAKKLCIKRCTDKNGFGHCEKCKKKVPKIYADHITQVGEVDAGFIFRMFVPSIGLQGLCKKCHTKKTNEERKRQNRHKAKLQDFY